MPSLTRPPSPALRPFVRTLWISDEPAAAGPILERALPTGLMHLVFRLTPDPVVLADDERGANRRSLGHAVVGGARSAAYVRDVSGRTCSVGAQLEPGSASLLFGAPASALGERHTRLDDLWGARAVSEARERLAESGSLARRLGVFEALLCARLRFMPPMPAIVAPALACFGRGGSVAEAVRATGVSHRYLAQVFRAEVGLGPKVYARVLRFQRALALLRARGRSPLADVALAAGFSDQAHLTRELMDIGGITPARYRAVNPAQQNHMPIGAG